MVRDYGPAFLVNFNKSKKNIVNWNYNSWGNKYPSFYFNNIIREFISEKLDIPIFYPKIVIEGGSVDFNSCRGAIFNS